MNEFIGTGKKGKGDRNKRRESRCRNKQGAQKDRKAEDEQGPTILKYQATEISHILPLSIPCLVKTLYLESTMTYTTEAQLEGLKKEIGREFAPEEHLLRLLTLEERRIDHLAKMSLIEMDDDADLTRRRCGRSHMQRNLSMASGVSESSIMNHVEIKDFTKRGIHRVKSVTSLYETIEDEKRREKQQVRQKYLEKIGKVSGGMVFVVFAPLLLLCGSCGGAGASKRGKAHQADSPKADLTNQSDESQSAVQERLEYSPIPSIIEIDTMPNVSKGRNRNDKICTHPKSARSRKNRSST